MNDKVWALISVVLLVVGLGGGFFLGQASAPAPTEVECPEVPTTQPGLTGTIPIGVVMIGSVAPRQDPPQEEWLETEINNYIKNVLHKNFTIDLVYEYAERSAQLALEKLQTLYAQGVRVAVGFRWSSSVQAVMEYANEHKIVIISEGSTSPKLAIPNDYIFRLVPNDNLQSRALLALHKNIGTKAIVLIYRGDAWGDGLAEKFKEFASEFGVQIVGEVRYSPEATEFSGEVAQLAQKITEAKQQYGNNVAVQTFTFDEIATILQQAKDYEILMNTLWVGSDGYVGEDVVVRDAPDQSLATVHISTIYAPTKSAKWIEYSEKYRSITGEDPGAYGAAFYDAVWVAALSIIEAGVYDGEVIKEVVPYVANNYFGVTGWCRLDETGDRAAADYSVSFVGLNSTGGIDWIDDAAIINVATGEVTWNVMPDLSRFGWELPAGAGAPAAVSAPSLPVSNEFTISSLLSNLVNTLQNIFNAFTSLLNSLIALPVDFRMYL